MSNPADRPVRNHPDRRSERDHDAKRRRRSITALEWLTIVHVSAFWVGATWAFGGQADWVRLPLTAWGSLGGLITLSVLLQRSRERCIATHVWWWAVPVLLFNAAVLVATFNPSLREIHFGQEVYLANVGGRPGWPSSALPEFARHGLWEFDAIWIACFNVALLVSRRRALRTLLLIATLNAVALAVFGTVQKLTGSAGIFFGAVPSPQKYFFASFVYHNHWGAFMLLMIAACLAITRHYSLRSEARDFFHSPAFAGAVAVLLLAVSIPLSASRSCTVLVGAFLLGAVLHWTAHLVRKRRYYHESIVVPLIATGLAVVVGIGAIGYLARDTISARISLTLEQIHHAKTTHRPDARVQLYEDTGRMAAAKPWFGWGMGSYPHVFTLYNTRQSVDGFPVFYHDAHSDWLQALAEHGVIGSLLLAASVLVPLATTGRRAWRTAPAVYLLSSCALLVLYALVEFPFGNFAVVLSWWLCFFIALKYAQLTAAKNHPLEQR